MLLSQQLDEILRPLRDRYMARHGAENWVGAPLIEEEAGLLFRAFRSELLRIDHERDRLELIGFPPGASGGRAKSYAFFSHNRSTSNAYWSWPEMFIQIGFATELVLDFEWPSQSVAIESKNFDVVASDPGGPVIMAEAKVEPKKLDAQMRVFLAGAGGDGTDDKRFRDLLVHKPKVYAAVARGTRRYYDLIFSKDGLEFQSRPEPPRPTDH